MRQLAFFRTVIFYMFFVPFTFAWSAIVILMWRFVPQKRRFHFIVLPWAWTARVLSYLVLGMRVVVEGKENIPKNQPVIIVANHQSAWETFYLQTLIYPQSQVVKKQLMDIPIFGSAYAQTKPIPIDRKDRRGAMTQVKECGKEMLNCGHSVMIFPEGTRAPVEHGYRFTKGAAVMAQDSGYPILPIAQNSGHVWLNKEFIKLPGLIKVKILPLVTLSPEQTVEELTENLQTMILSELGLVAEERPRSRNDQTAAQS